MTSLLTEPRLGKSDTDTPNVAHFFCIVEHENKIHRGLCHTPLRGRQATWSDVWCSVCADLVDDHRAGCAPCMSKWGPADKRN